MRFFRQGDLDISQVQYLTAKEVNYVAKVWNNRNLLPKNLNASFSNLYHIARRYEYPWFQKIIKEEKAAKQNIVIGDLGCGVSFAPFYYSGYAKEYIAFDCLNLSKFYETFKGIKFKQHDITTEFGYSEHFDIVISISVLEHLPFESILKVLENSHKILKRGGIFVLSFDIDLENDNSGLSFDQLAYIVYYMEKLGFKSRENIDLTLYDDIVTTENYNGLQSGRFRLPWRIGSNNIRMNLFQRKLFALKSLISTSSVSRVPHIWSSVAFVRSVYEKI